MRIRFPLLILLLMASSTWAQELDKPLSGFDKLAHRCTDAAELITSERKRLGNRFEKELLNFLGSDVDKHYWVSCSLSGCSSPTTDQSLEMLSLLIRQQALSLLVNKTDDHSLYTSVSLHVLSAVQSEQLGFHNMAVGHKTASERLVSVRPILKGGFPAMSKEEWQTYDSLAISVREKSRRSKHRKS